MRKVYDFLLGALIWCALFVLVAEPAEFGHPWLWKLVALAVGAVATYCLTKSINRDGKHS
jgi:Na+-transporting NADH:ubiquinone oxidoreductase subunit NqrB